MMTASLVGPTMAPRTRLRLTRRGRILFSLLIAVPLVVGTLATAVSAVAVTGSSPNSSIVTVEAGQSLWQIAALVAPGANPADVVAELVAINGLSGATVQPGQALVLPAHYAD
jgi:LysM repeat protein